jgi:hypothetical protein
MVRDANVTGSSLERQIRDARTWRRGRVGLMGDRILSQEHRLLRIAVCSLVRRADR